MNKLRKHTFFERITPLYFFLVVGFVFGTLFLLITPPFQGADEVVHYYRANQVAEGTLKSENYKNKTGGYLPDSIRLVIAETSPSLIKFHPEYKYSELRTKNALSIHDTSKRSFYEFASTASYSPVPYIPAAIFIKIAHILSLPTLVSLYAARLGDLLLWLFLGGMAIYFMPYRKWALVAIALLPMAIFQAATLNADSATIGSFMLLLSLILWARAKSTGITTTNYLSLLGVSTIMLLSKPVMIIFLPLVFLIRQKDPKKQLFNRELIWKMVIIAAPIFILGGWMLLSSGIQNSALENQQQPGVQFSHIVHTPFNYLNVMWNTYFYNWGDTVVRSFVGIFGWADTPLSELIVTLGYIGLAFLLIGSTTDKVRLELTKNEKRFAWLIAVAYFIAVSTTIYIFYTPVDFKIIYGLQGRYFIPLAILAIPLLWSNKIKIEKQLYRKIAIFMPVFLLSSSVITVGVRYFVHNV